MKLRWLRNLLILGAVATFPIILAQQSRNILPMIAGGSVPLYPPLARAANVQGDVHISIGTDGAKVITAQVKDGHRLLSVAAEENVRTWQFSKHDPTSFTVTYRYRIDPAADPNNPTVKIRFPIEVEVSMAPLVLSDPPSDVK